MDDRLKRMLDAHATTPSIRDLVGDDSRTDNYRTAREDECTTALPGDDVDASINKYMALAATRPLQVVALLRSGALSPEDAEEAQAALDLYTRFTGQDVTPRR